METVTKSSANNKGEVNFFPSVVLNQHALGSEV